MPQSQQRNSLLNRPVPESAKRRRENAKYVKYPKTSRATRSGAAAAAWKLVHTTKKSVSGHSPHNGRPAPPTLRSLHTAPAGGVLPETRAIPGQNGVVWLAGWVGWGGRGKKGTQKVWVRVKTNARRKTHRGVATKTRAHAKVLRLERKLRPPRRTLRWEKRSKKRFVFNATASSSSRVHYYQ